MALHSDTVLITGSGGFTGRALASAFSARGSSVVGLSKAPREAWELEGDLLDRPGLASTLAETRPDIVIHLAGISSPVHGDISEIYEANVVGTASLISSISRSVQRPRLILVASSATVYAKADSGVAQRETDSLEPVTHYAASKLAVEHICNISGDLPIRVLRPFNYTGAGQGENFLVPKIVAHFARDTGEIELGNLDLERDISDISDVVESYIRLSQMPSGEVLNLCSGVPAPLTSIVDILREISGRSMRVRVNEKFVRPGEPKRIFGDRSALDGAIGSWKRRTLHDTLSAMYSAALQDNGA